MPWVVSRGQPAPLVGTYRVCRYSRDVSRRLKMAGKADRPKPTQSGLPIFENQQNERPCQKVPNLCPSPVANFLGESGMSPHPVRQQRQAKIRLGGVPEQVPHRRQIVLLFPSAVAFNRFAGKMQARLEFSKSLFPAALANVPRSDAPANQAVAMFWKLRGRAHDCARFSESKNPCAI